MRLAVAALFLTASLAAQSNLPTKEDPKGYSKDVVDAVHQPMKSDLGEQKTYTPPSKETAPPPAALPADLNKVVAEQFGTDCKIAVEKSSVVVNYRVKSTEPWTPFLTADLDGNGSEDAIIVARCKSALARRDEFGYTVIDPYMAYHGYGDPRITAEFSSGDPMQGHLVLIIHGEGAEGWRAAKPRAKFILINLPFSMLGVTKVATRKGKPPVSALMLQEGETMSSVVYWNGKKYQWRDGTQSGSK